MLQNTEGREDACNSSRLELGKEIYNPTQAGYFVPPIANARRYTDKVRKFQNAFSKSAMLPLYVRSLTLL